eukprot:308833_1
MATAEQEWFWLTKVSIQSVSSFILICLCLYHCYQTIRDFYMTKLLFQKTPPAIKYANILTCIAITLFTLSAVSVLFKQSVFFISYCLIIDAAATITFVLAKMVLFTVLFLKLHIVYKSSQYEYSQLKLKAIAAVIIMYDLIFLMFYTIIHQVEPYKYDTITYGINCNPVYIPSIMMALTIPTVLCPIGFTIAFIRPLKKISNTTKSESQDWIKAGWKVAVIVCPTFISTFTLMLLVMISDIGVLYSSIDII